MLNIFYDNNLDFAIISAYGMSEHGLSHVCLAKPVTEAKLGSVGVLTPMYECKV